MASNLLMTILGWLRAGYPEGVPPKDCFPLVALLRRTLSDDEFDEITSLLEQESAPIGESDIRAVIHQVTEEPPDEDAVREVAAKLASAGWPLSGDVHELIAEDDDADRAEKAPGVVERVLAWLRAGYPDGVPVSDYIPLLALLRRRLSDDEVRQIADALISVADADGEVPRLDAQVLMTRVLDELPSDEDLARVDAHLRTVGVSLV